MSTNGTITVELEWDRICENCEQRKVTLSIDINANEQIFLCKSCSRIAIGLMLETLGDEAFEIDP